MRLLYLLAASATVLSAAGCTAEPSPTVDAEKLAACLTERGAIMYGADWCSHCQEQQRMFGKAFSAVRYVECPDEPQRCVQASITGYPTWVFPDGQKREGVQPLPELAGVAGCAKGLEKNTLPISHPIFPPSSAASQSRNPRRSLGYACGFAQSPRPNLAEIWARTWKVYSFPAPKPVTP